MTPAGPSARPGELSPAQRGLWFALGLGERSGRSARADRVTPSARGAVCARRRRKEGQRRAAQRSCLRAGVPGARIRRNGRRRPRGTSSAVERCRRRPCRCHRAQRNDEGEKRSGPFGPRAAQRPDSSGRARGSRERGPCGPPGGSGATVTEGRSEAERARRPAGSAAVEALAVAQWAQRRAGALHGGRLT
jgi:hypothetical protein